MDELHTRDLEDSDVPPPICEGWSDPLFMLGNQQILAVEKRAEEIIWKNREHR